MALTDKKVPTRVLNALAVSAIVAAFIFMMSILIDIVKAAADNRKNIELSSAVTEQLKFKLIDQLRNGEEVKEEDLSKLSYPQLRDFMYALNTHIQSLQLQLQLIEKQQHAKYNHEHQSAK